MRRIRVGDRIRHTKTGNEYIVECEARIEATDEPAFVYYNDGVGFRWVRPVKEFQQVVRIDGELVPRFAIIGDDDDL